MAKIQRKTQKIFGASAGNRSFTAFGTAKSESPTYTQDLDLIQNNAYNYGWEAAVLEDRAPYEEDTNGLIYMLTYQLAYLMQQGAAVEYDKNTTYYKGSIVTSSDGSGTWYKSLADDNTGNDLSNSAYWQTIELAKNGMPLFTQITTDHILTGDDAIGWAIQGSEVLNTVYPDAYTKILNLYNSGTDVTYRGITAKRTIDGRYIADIAQQAAVNNLFSNTGIADFYVISQTEQKFWLPKTSRFIQYTTDTTLLNQFNDSGLPSLAQSITATTTTAGTHTHNGTAASAGNHYHGSGGENSQYSSPYGLYNAANNHYGFNSGVDRDNTIWKTSTDGAHSHNITANSAGNHAHNLTITISNPNQIYGRVNFVQPPASLKLLYYRVGDTAV